MAVSVFITLFLSVLIIGPIHCGINVSDYIYWRKADINQWHKYFPSRLLEEEKLINDAARSSYSTDITGDLKKILTFPYNELETAKQLMAGTDAEGCVNGLSNYLDQAIKDHVESYQDCIADVPSNLARLDKSRTKSHLFYQAAYQRAPRGIYACAKTYPNKDSMDRLRSCVESMNDNYYKTANSIQSTFSSSPSMSYFQSSVVACASTAANNVASKGWQFLNLLANCASLSGIIDPEAYREQLSQWKGYQDTLKIQFQDSQINHKYQVSQVENGTVVFYNLMKQASENYVISTRELSYYLSKIYSYLGDYYNTLTATSLDNPGDQQCTADARSKLDAIAQSGASQSLSCDQFAVKDTKQLMSEVDSNIMNINNMMKNSGNVALLKCYSQGYVFAPYTIKHCYDLVLWAFAVEYSDFYQNITGDVHKINTYINKFVGNEDLPCGGSSVSIMINSAEKVLYELQRCLYKSSGTNYQATTPSSYTTTPTTSPSIPSTTETYTTSPYITPTYNPSWRSTMDA